MARLTDRIRLFDGLTYDRHVYGKGPGRDPDLLIRGVEEPTELERAGMARLSDLDLEVLYHKMTAIVEEAREVYMNLSISEGIITGDMNTSIFTAQGDPAVVATGIYFHALLNYAQVKYILRYYRDDPTVGLRDGDIFFFNDPTCGGVHTFDMFATMPIFWKGELIAWAEVGGHQGECGSISPGGFSPRAKTRWEEGLHVHALKIGENFELRRDILDFLLNSVRNPFVLASDLKARVGTCMRIRERVLREVERRSPQAVAGGLRRIINFSGSLARARLREVNDGIYRSILFLDSVGTDVGLVRVPTTVIKEEDSLTVVVQGVSPENGMGPMHSTWHLTKAALGVYLFSHLFRGLPPNIGLFEPVTILVEGPSVANASDEVAHGEGTSIASAVVQNLHVIGSKMLFGSLYRDAVSAPFGRNEQLLIFAGVNRFGYQTANFTGVQNALGQGARFDLDGEDGMGFFWGPLTDAGESEEMDVRLPPFTLSRVVDTNYHGFGKYRGGAPITEVSMVLGPHRCLLTSRGFSDRVSQNPGLFGGYAAPPNPRFIIRQTDVLERLGSGDTSLVFTQYDLATRKRLKGEYVYEPSGMPTQSYTEGDLFIHSVGAGGGYGDVLERDATRVMKDLREGLITSEVARKIYHVVFDETLQVDEDATQREREAERRARLARGKRFDEFMAEWLPKKPKGEILRYYGHWPEPRLPEYREPFWGIY